MQSTVEQQTHSQLRMHVYNTVQGAITVQHKSFLETICQNKI
jgi:hypothetical protein